MNYSLEATGALQVKLSSEEGLPVAYAAILAEHALFQYDKRVRAGVLQWLDGTLTDAFTVEDLSLADIQQEIGCSLFQALSVMDIYLRNPEYSPSVLRNEARDFVGIQDFDMSEMISVEDLEDEE